MAAALDEIILINYTPSVLASYFFWVAVLCVCLCSYLYRLLIVSFQMMMPASYLWIYSLLAVVA